MHSRPWHRQQLKHGIRWLQPWCAAVLLLGACWIPTTAPTRLPEPSADATNVSAAANLTFAPTTFEPTPNPTIAPTIAPTEIPRDFEVFAAADPIPRTASAQIQVHFVQEGSPDKKVIRSCSVPAADVLNQARGRLVILKNPVQHWSIEPPQPPPPPPAPAPAPAPAQQNQLSGNSSNSSSNNSSRSSNSSSSGNTSSSSNR